MNYADLAAEARSHADLVGRLAAALEDAAAVSRLHEIATARTVDVSRRVAELEGEHAEAQAALLESLADAFDDSGKYEVPTGWLRSHAGLIRKGLV